MSIVRFASLFLVLGVTACAQSNPGNAPSAFSPIQPNGQVTQGRCHMDGCSWAKWVGVDTLSASDSEVVLDAKLLYGSSEHQSADGHTGESQYPASAQGVNIRWDAQPETERIVCSRTAPSVANHVLPLNPNMPVSGSEESAARLYFAACHSYFDGYMGGISKFGYDVKDQH